MLQHKLVLTKKLAKIIFNIYNVRTINLTDTVDILYHYGYTLDTYDVLRLIKSNHYIENFKKYNIDINQQIFKQILLNSTFSCNHNLISQLDLTIDVIEHLCMTQQTTGYLKKLCSQTIITQKAFENLCINHYFTDIKVLQSLVKKHNFYIDRTTNDLVQKTYSNSKKKNYITSLYDDYCTKQKETIKNNNVIIQNNNQ